jgi:NodT family efflux transporter outer membrane factor (OMF) lipoprotein
VAARGGASSTGASRARLAHAGAWRTRLGFAGAWRAWLGLVGALVAAGCAQAPPLKLPEVAVPESFREVAPWTPAEPADQLPREAWWRLFGDARLDALQQRLIERSPDLAAAYARYEQARAATDQALALQSPTLSASLGVRRDQQSELRPLRVLSATSPDRYSTATLGLGLDYEVDLWGRVKSQVDAGVALGEAAEADLASARLVLQAQLADSYVALRGLDREAVLLRDAEDALDKALAVVQRRHDGGIASGLDLARAQGQLETTRSQARQSAAQRAVLEHAIASLVGETASAFAIAPEPTDLPLPRVPPGLPSTLLQRRPDIAAAERRVAAANASVGVARAAFFPAVMLSAQGGYQSSDLARFIRAPNIFWSIGPSLVANLFDGGRRKAEEARVLAVLDESGARYRGVVIAAFQQVEDNLALLDRYGAAAESEERAVAAAQRSLDLANARYREGAASYLEVVTSQTAALQAQRSALDLATRQRRAGVQLIRALGGGWSVAEMSTISSR